VRRSSRSAFFSLDDDQEFFSSSSSSSKDDDEDEDEDDFAKRLKKSRFVPVVVKSRKKRVLLRGVKKVGARCFVSFFPLERTHTANKESFAVVVVFCEMMDAKKRLSSVKK